jgi:hypothetical protein
VSLFHDAVKILTKAARRGIIAFVVGLALAGFTFVAQNTLLIVLVGGAYFAWLYVRC